MAGRMLLRMALTLWLGLLVAAGAHAQCSVSNASPASFGTVTSFVVKNTQQRTSSTNAGISCSGGTLVLAVTNTVDSTVNSMNNGYLAGPTGDKIPYTLYADSKYSIPLNFGTQYNWASGQLLNIFGLLGNGGSAPLPLYLQTTTGSTVAAGTYTDTLTIQWNWDICIVGIGPICITNTGSTSTTIPVTITITNDCMITAPNVSFGSAPTVASFTPVSGSLSLICTKGMTYTVGLGAGNNAAGNGRRQMASGSNRLQYDIYRAGSPTVWGDTSNRASSAGAADGISVQSFPYTASIYTDQATPPIGTYTDTVIVDVRY